MARVRSRLRIVAIVLGLAVLVLVTSNCTMLSLNVASLRIDDKAPATPALEVRSLDAWRTQVDGLRDAFARHVYGPWPDGLAVSFGATRVVDAGYQDGLGRLEETPITIGDGAGARTFRLVTAHPVLPAGTRAPLILAQTFAKGCRVFLGAPISAADGEVCDTEEDVPGLVRFIFGRFIARAPTEQYLRRGYAYASFYAGELVPDSGEEAQAVMADLSTSGEELPTGALMAWAYGYSAALTLLEADPRVDPARTALFGHSRHGKAALVAAAWDPRVDAVFAHQSGFGGAALNRSRVGEGLGRVASSYGYWFDPAYASWADRLDAMPVDQHQLLALIAPRPVLLGNARRDVWSDPNSTFRAALGADPIYELFGVDGLVQQGLLDFEPSGELAFHLRSGAHGVQQEDVDAMLAFFDRHFGGPFPAPEAATGAGAAATR